MINDYSNIKAIFFDFDDTLGFREEYAYDTFYTLFQSYLKINDEVELESILQDCMIWEEQGNIYKNHIIEMLKQKYDIELPFDDFEKWWNEEQWKAVVPFPDTIQTLEVLKEKYLLAIITNGDSIAQRKKIEQAGIMKYFDESHIFVSGDYPYRKPDTRIFENAMKQLNVKPEESIYVGDIFSNDVIGAYRAHMNPIWIWTHGDRKCHADITRIKKISDLLRIL